MLVIPKCRHERKRYKHVAYCSLSRSYDGGAR